jgi:hypothetical protein
MPRPRRPPQLEVRESFEPTRLAPQCLVAVYSRVVPVPRKKILKAVAPEPQPPAIRPRSSGGEHG